MKRVLGAAIVAVLPIIFLSAASSARADGPRARATVVTVAPVTTPMHGQAWITPDNHEHTEIADAPHLQRISSPVQIHVTTRFHNRVGKLTFVEVGYGPSGTALERHTYSNRVGDRSPEQTWEDVFTIDPARLPSSGWTELRVRSNDVENGQREFTTSRLCVFIDNGKPRSDYCGGPTVAGRCGFGAWYEDTQYRIAYVDCRDDYRLRYGAQVAGPTTVRVKPQDGPGIITLDPNFHAGNPGRVIATNLPANRWTTVTIPGDLAPGRHVLHFRVTGGNVNPAEAGVYVVPFTVAGDGPPPPPPVEEPPGGEDPPPPSCDLSTASLTAAPRIDAPALAVL